jgi:hypothetical protein
MVPTAQAWLARVRHDLLKRLLWAARDRRDLGGPPRPGELVATLHDDEGRPTPAPALWAALRAEAPPAVPAAALDAFSRALEAAGAAASRDDLPGVLALEPAFDELARIVKSAKGAP